jgi:hypothetical protein
LPSAVHKSLHRCDTIDDQLTRLARQNPNTKFIRCRASAIGFALSSQAKPRSLRPPSSTYLSKSRTSPRYAHRDDDDPYGSDTAEPTIVDAFNRDEDEDEDEEDVDTDMLPTILVYRSGQLVHNWVRVDWEAGLLGIDELLERWVDSYAIHWKNFDLPSTVAMTSFSQYTLGDPLASPSMTRMIWSLVLLTTGSEQTSTLNSAINLPSVIVRCLPMHRTYDARSRPSLPSRLLIINGLYHAQAVKL